MDFLPFTRPTIDEEAIAAVGDVLRSGWITSGPKMKALEAALEQRYQRPVRTFSSATAAMEVALRLAGIGPGDEVITTPLSWVATVNVILTCGATPVFVDIDRASRNIDLDAVEAAITFRTKAIIPVDLAGLPVNRTKLYDLAKRHNLRVLEDAAQSMGANWNGSEIGREGDLISFSFHANKNMTSGEGGCLLLNNEDEARLAEKLRLQGVTRFADGSMDVDVLGGKSNLTDIAAVLGLHQLAKLDGFNAKRVELARAYFKHWNNALGCELPPADFAQSNWHMFQPLLPLECMSITRGEFIAKMRDAGIGVGVHYPAMHLFTLFRELGFKEGQFPHAEYAGSRTVTLPLFPAMSEEDVVRVCQTVTQILEPALS